MWRGMQWRLQPHERKPFYSLVGVKENKAVFGNIS